MSSWHPAGCEECNKQVTSTNRLPMCNNPLQMSTQWTENGKEKGGKQEAGEKGEGKAKKEEEEEKRKTRRRKLK